MTAHQRDLAGDPGQADVSCPTLAGHGTTPEDLEHTGRKDWLGSADQALELLQARHARVFVVGHSMGSTLALQLAARHPGITGLAVMAPSVKVSRRIRLLAVVLGRTRRWIPQQPMAVMDPATRADPALQGYRRMPTRAVRENLQQKADTRRLLGRVTAPALLLEGYHDPMAAKGSARSIAAALASSRKYVFVAYQSSHGLPVNRDREFVHRLIIAFIKQAIEEQDPAEIPEAQHARGALPAASTPGTRT